MQKNSKINHRYYLRFFGKFWVILVGNIKNRIFKLPIICTLYSLALIPVSCYANNLYCYINGELHGDKPINIKNIAIKQVKFFENGMQKDGYAVSLKDSQALLNYCKELDSEFSILEGVPIEARIDRNTWSSPITNLVGKQYGYPIVVKNKKNEYVRSAYTVAKGNKEILSVNSYLKKNANTINKRSKTYLVEKIYGGLKHYFDGVVAGETIFEAKYSVSGTSNFVADNYIKNLANIRGDRGIYKPSENEVVIYSYKDGKRLSFRAKNYEQYMTIVENITKYANEYFDKKIIKILYGGTVISSNNASHAVLLEVTIDNYDKTITLNMVDSLISHAANNASFSVLQSLKQGLERVNSLLYILILQKQKMMFIIYQRLLIVHTK
ncbi:conserved hypothetical protein [Francisella tularensis subsp. novicida GA99-3548]|nr:hypothetical protein AQ14_1286 [Francisella tularensis subsp. novicida D9876]EDN38146.1 conserved hypothetical protein [Francisella tularensis subsp. novicida GA99-3548]